MSHTPLLHRCRAWFDSLLTPRLGQLRQYPPRPLRWPSRPLSPPSPTPLISLVTPALNQGRFLERTLRSVLEQGYPHLEYVVQDGGSTDETVPVLEKYAARLAHWEARPDGGQAQALNRGFARAGGAILGWLNADDLLAPGSLACVATFFANRPEVDVVYGQRLLIDEDDREIGRWILPPHEDAALLWRDFVPQETLFWRRTIWERVGGRLDEGLQFALDWDLLLRFRRAGARFVRLPWFLGAFRVHAEQKTATMYADRGRVECAELLRREHGREVSEEEIERRVRRYLTRHVALDWLQRLGFG